MFSLLEGIFGALSWLLINAVYYDLRRKGVRGFARMILFCLGAPATILTFLLVRPGSAKPLTPPKDADEQLLAEIRADRELRGTLAAPEDEEGGRLGPNVPA